MAYGYPLAVRDIKEWEPRTSGGDTDEGLINRSKPVYGSVLDCRDSGDSDGTRIGSSPSIQLLDWSSATDDSVHQVETDVAI